MDTYYLFLKCLYSIFYGEELIPIWSLIVTDNLLTISGIFIWAAVFKQLLINSLFYPILVTWVGNARL